MLQEKSTKSEKITFSVIIPAYNVEPYLARCLDSVLPALNENDEIILSLEDSTDESNVIAQQYAQMHKNVRTVYHDIKGLSNARNYAMQESVGTYIVYIDGDDRVNTETFAMVLRDIRRDCSSKNIPVDLYAYDFYCDNCMTGELESRFQIGECGDFQGIENIHRMLKTRGCFWNVWRYIYRRKFLTENAIIFSEKRLCEDVDYITSVLLANPRAIFRHDPYYIYTRHRAGSIMNIASLKRLEDVVYMLERSIQRMRNAKMRHSRILAARFQYEYILNMAVIYELPEEKREAGELLFKNAGYVLAGSQDVLVRIMRCFVKYSGVMLMAYLLHMAKKLRYRCAIGRHIS